MQTYLDAWKSASTSCAHIHVHAARTLSMCDSLRLSRTETFPFPLDMLSRCTLGYKNCLSVGYVCWAAPVDDPGVALKDAASLLLTRFRLEAGTVHCLRKRITQLIQQFTYLAYLVERSGSSLHLVQFPMKWARTRQIQTFPQSHIAHKEQFR